jgi:pimeloyl-ACP methyl ester carboxylesterase
MLPLYYEQYGSGSPLVCLHGFGASTYTWREIRSALAANHEVYALDLKGFGKSPKPRDGAYSVHDQASLVIQFILDHKLRGVTLVGHSFGGGVALATAVELERTQPGTLGSLILIDAASYPQRLPLFIEMLRMPVIAPLVQRFSAARFQVRTVLRKAYLNDGLIPDASVDAYASALRQPGGEYALRETAKQIIPRDIGALSSKYPTITVPTLIIWGRHDEIVPLNIGDRLHAAINGSQFLVVDNAGHLPHEETPEPVRAALTHFFQETKQ